MAENNGSLRTSWLGKLLRDRREEHGLKLAEAAEYLNRSASILSRMENGHLPIPKYDVEALLDLYRVTDRAWRESLLRLHAQSGVSAWWDLYSEDVSEPVLDLVWLESMATSISTYCATVIDGLLQTADYALAVSHAHAHAGRHGRESSRWVELMTLRQAVFSRAQPPAFAAIIDEGVLHRPVGGPAGMAAQLRHLVRLGEHPDIELRVLPFAAGVHASLDGGFRVFQLPPPLTEVVAVGCALGQLYVEPPRTERLVTAYDRLRQSTLAPSVSAELIAARAEHWENA